MVTLALAEGNGASSTLRRRYPRATLTISPRSATAHYNLAVLYEQAARPRFARASPPW
jgi:hypothetical protein